MLLILLAVGAALALLFLGAQWLEQQEEKPEIRGDYHLRYAQDVQEINGKQYRPKTNLTTILLIGVDKESDAAQTGFRNGGQADFLRLLVLDHANETISQLAIDRDTMTPITILGVLGNRSGMRTLQICLSHGFGDGKEQSCELTKEAVSNLLLSTPIQAYIAMNLDGISSLNDLAGGVTVTLEDDFSSLDPAMTVGKTLTLWGRQAELFVRSRMSMAIGTNAARMLRQQTYIAKLTELLDGKIKSSAEFMGTLFDSLSPYLVSSLSRAQLINDAWSARDYVHLPVTALPGEHRVGSDGFMEFHVDESALQDIVLQMFYQEVK